MADVTVTKIDVRPLNGSVTLNKPAGEATEIGEVVYMESDGDVNLADADAEASARVIGICVSTPQTGVVDAVAGDRLDITVFGPVAGFTSLTPGAQYFASTNPGKIGDTAPAGSSGDFKWIIGWAVDAETLFIDPYTDDPAAQ
jgi:hypothetical protein